LEKQQEYGFNQQNEGTMGITWDRLFGGLASRRKGYEYDAQLSPRV
jgi:hypothetical protein